MRGERIPIQIRLKYPERRLFEERFAPYISPYGMFLPTSKQHPKQTPIAFSFVLADGQPVFQGFGQVLELYQPPAYPVAGLALRFTALSFPSQAILQTILGHRQALSPLVPTLSPSQIDALPEEAFLPYFSLDASASLPPLRPGAPPPGAAAPYPIPPAAGGLAPSILPPLPSSRPMTSAVPAFGHGPVSYPPQYPSSQAPYPSSQAPYPSSQAPYPPSQAPYPPSQAPYPPSQAPYPPSQAPYPPSQAPYPPQNPLRGVPQQGPQYPQAPNVPIPSPSPIARPAPGYPPSPSVPFPGGAPAGSNPFGEAALRPLHAPSSPSNPHQNPPLAVFEGIPLPEDAPPSPSLPSPSTPFMTSIPRRQEPPPRTLPSSLSAPLYNPPPQPQASPQASPQAPPPQPPSPPQTAQAPHPAPFPPPPFSPSVPPSSRSRSSLFFEGAESDIPQTGPIIGIDLGTTNTCCAVVEEGRAHVIPSRLGYNTIPSVVALDPQQGDLLIGHPAKNQILLNPHQTIYGAKRLVGRKFRSRLVQLVKSRFLYEILEMPDGDAGVRLGSQTLTLQQISALLLKEIREIAQEYLQQPVNRAVISVPAYYNDSQRHAVRQAGLLAGMRVERIINEPTAAALAYGAGKQINRTIFVYDLGGGTFDASILHVHEDVFEVISTGGNPFLGGVDFDNRLLDFIIGKVPPAVVSDLRNDPIKIQRIKEAAEKAKCDLSQQEQANIQIPYLTVYQGAPLNLDVWMNRAQLNELVRDLVNETIHVCEAVLKAGGLQRTDIHEILLVGGQTRMPLIHQAVSEFFGRPPLRSLHPDEAVALGTAQLAGSFGRRDHLRLIDVLAVPIGLALPQDRFQILVPKNTPLPFQRVFAISLPSGSASVDLFQGEHPTASENDYLGSLDLSSLFAGGSPGRIDLSLHLNNEGLLTISARNPYTSGPPQQLRLLTSPDGRR